MTRISERVLVQRVGVDHLVVMDDHTGFEVVLSASRDAARLLAAVAHLAKPGDPFGLLADAREILHRRAEESRRGQCYRCGVPLDHVGSLLCAACLKREYL